MELANLDKLSTQTSIEEFVKKYGKKYFNKGSSTPPAAVDPCKGPQPNQSVEYSFYFSDFRFTSEINLGDSDTASNDFSTLELACSPITDGGIYHGISTRYSQGWNFRKQSIGDLASTLSLLPKEKLSITAKRFKQTTYKESRINENEEETSYDYSTHDKDVVNVMSSASKSNSWSVSTNSSISLFGFVKAGVSTNNAGSTQSSVQRSLNQISESTTKASNQARSLSKVEISQDVTTKTEKEVSRSFENPYRNRSLIVNVFELNKHYNVTTRLEDIRFSLVLEMNDILMDRDYVIANVDFLDRMMLDRGLFLELSSALEKGKSLGNLGKLKDADYIARLALDYLFDDEHDIFGIKGDNGNVVASYSAGKLSGEDGIDTKSGLYDSIENKFGIGFATLSYYREMYRKEKTVSAVFPGQSVETVKTGFHRNLPSFAVSLADTMSEKLMKLEGDEKVDELFDDGKRTEAVRRVPGFVSIVDNLLRPMLGIAKDEEGLVFELNRVEHVIDRAVKHLECHKKYYVKKYVRYLVNKTGYDAFAGTIEDYVLKKTNNDTAKLNFYKEYFDFGASYIDGLRYIIPLKEDTDLGAFVESTSDSVPDYDYSKSEEVIIPSEGVYMEPVIGKCALRGVPRDRSTFYDKLKGLFSG